MSFTKAVSLLLVLLAIASCGKSDRYIRNNVVMLKSEKGQCSGIQVKGPSGTPYILTAGHCSHLAKDGSMTVITEDKRHLSRRVIEEDANSDLLLLEGLPDENGLGIALKSERFEGVRTFTHGRGHDTYQTTGVIVEDAVVNSPPSIVKSQEEYDSCVHQSKYMFLPIGNTGMCFMLVKETVITAEIVPGSSGGAVVNAKGQLVGIASMTGGGFHYMVRLSDIQTFLANY